MCICQYKLALHPYSKEGLVHPELYQQGCNKKVQEIDSSLLLSICEATSEVLCSILGSAFQYRYGQWVGIMEGYEDSKKAGGHDIKTVR